MMKLWRRRFRSSSSLLSSSPPSSSPSPPPLPSASSSLPSSLSSSSSSSSSLSLSITPSCFKDQSVLNLILISSLFKLCSYDSLVSLISKILSNKNNIITTTTTYIIKNTVFLYFCGGNNYNECKNIINKYYNNYNITTIIDHSTEEIESEEYSHDNLIKKINLLTIISNDNNNNAIRYIPIKCTSLINPNVLEKLTIIINNKHNNNNNDDDIINKLNDNDKQLYDNGIKRFYTLCKLAKAKKISLLLDAEQSNRQPAIEYIYNILARKYNIINDDNSLNIPVIYNTYQLYLARTSEALYKDILLAKTLRYNFGAKIVRGAYMKTESLRSPNPILSSKDDVDNNYNNVVKNCLTIVKTQQEDSKSKSFATFLFASHNRKSIQTVVDTMHFLGIDNGSSYVSLAQIKGMVDPLTNLLALRGYNVSKLVPYGNFEELLPWLIRRLEENNGIFSAMQHERKHYHQEILRRLKSLITLH